MIRLGQDICEDLSAALTREWLETNGLGGYASSTIAGVNTRRYHGLLVAATQPPVGHLVMLSKLEEVIVIDGRRHELSTNQYPGVVHPQGYKLQTGFRLDPFPIFTYEIEGLLIEKSVFMLPSENTTVIQYQFQTKDGDAARPRLTTASYSLELRPLIAFRDYHSLAHENGWINSGTQSEAGLTTVRPYADLPALHFAHDADEIETASYWYRNFEYSQERARGFDFAEDLFSPFNLKFDLSNRTGVTLIASTERRELKLAHQIPATENKRGQTFNTAPT